MTALFSFLMTVCRLRCIGLFIILVAQAEAIDGEAPATLRIQVKHGDEVVSGATLKIREGSSEIPRLMGADDEVKLVIAPPFPRVVVISAEKEGYSSLGDQYVWCFPGMDSPVRFELQQNPTLHEKVVVLKDNAGGLLRGIHSQLKLGGEVEKVVFIDGSGAIVIEHSESQKRAEILVGRRKIAVDLEAKGEMTAVVDLRGAGYNSAESRPWWLIDTGKPVVSGTLHGPDGRPATGWWVVAGGGEPIKIGADGSFAFTSLVGGLASFAGQGIRAFSPEGLHFWFQIRMQGTEAYATRRYRLTIPPLRQRFNGQLKDTDGLPVAGHPIMQTGDIYNDLGWQYRNRTDTLWPILFSQTDREGRYMLPFHYGFTAVFDWGPERGLIRQFNFDHNQIPSTGDPRAQRQKATDWEGYRRIKLTPVLKGRAVDGFETSRRDFASIENGGKRRTRVSEIYKYPTKNGVVFLAPVSASHLEVRGAAPALRERMFEISMPDMLESRHELRFRPSDQVRSEDELVDERHRSDYSFGRVAKSKKTDLRLQELKVREGMKARVLLPEELVFPDNQIQIWTYEDNVRKRTKQVFREEVGSNTFVTRHAIKPATYRVRLDDISEYLQVPEGAEYKAKARTGETATIDLRNAPIKAAAHVLPMRRFVIEVEHEGEPAPGASVAWTTRYKSHLDTADADGLCYLEVPARAVVSVAARLPGVAAGWKQFTVLPTQLDERLTLELKPTRTLQVTIDPQHSDLEIHAVDWPKGAIEAFGLLWSWKAYPSVVSFRQPPLKEEPGWRRVFVRQAGEFIIEDLPVGVDYKLRSGTGWRVLAEREVEIREDDPSLIRITVGD